MATGAPLEAWRRGPRSSFALSAEPGVYALFLREGRTLPRITPGRGGLIYIGLAANRQGLKGRCHFDAKTRNHSPRKSLAALLMHDLDLVPILIPKPNSSDTWGLDAKSEARLSAWMHDNLDLAIEINPNPDLRESELIALHAPPLNLTKCAQTVQHRGISEVRARIMASLSVGSTAAVRRVAATASEPTGDSLQAVGAGLDTANAIAGRYGLDPKAYRQQLRKRIVWYRNPQDWTFPVNSREWLDIIVVAEDMSR